MGERTCTHNGCPRPVWARGFCGTHYDFARRTGLIEKLPQLTFEERFWSKVNKDGPIPSHRPELGQCWVWTAASDDFGYGRIGKGGRLGKDMLTHRASWEIHYGPVPSDLCVLHGCDNPACVRPDAGHLFLGTRQDNMADKMRKGRYRLGQRATGEANHAAKLTEAAVIEVRRRHALGETMASLARRFDVSNFAISQLVKRRTWRHVA